MGRPPSSTVAGPSRGRTSRRTLSPGRICSGPTQRMAGRREAGLSRARRRDPDPAAASKPLAAPAKKTPWIGDVDLRASMPPGPEVLCREHFADQPGPFGIGADRDRGAAQHISVRIQSEDLDVRRRRAEVGQGQSAGPDAECGSVHVSPIRSPCRLERIGRAPGAASKDQRPAERDVGRLHLDPAVDRWSDGESGEMRYPDGNCAVRSNVQSPASWYDL